MNELIKVNNAVKWILFTTNDAGAKQVSESFAFKNRKCTFVFYSGYFTFDNDSKPITLSMDFEQKEKFNPAIDVTIQVSNTSEILSPPAKVSVTGEDKQVIWRSNDFRKLRSSRLTFEMVIQDDILKNDKSVQTSSYIDACILLDDTSKDFAKMFEEGLEHDMEFLCGAETIKAHKNILCSRSKVFASMLRNDMQERKTGHVKIQDMESGIFRRFLRCLYTGELPELTVDTALGLYEASDKYAVDTLKKQCADFLMDHASPEDACEILLLADRHSDCDFKKNVIEYMIKVEKPITGDKWTDFCKENPVLATEVLNLYCKHLREK